MRLTINCACGGCIEIDALPIAAWGVEKEEVEKNREWADSLISAFWIHHQGHTQAAYESFEALDEEQEAVGDD